MKPIFWKNSELFFWILVINTYTILSSKEKTGGTMDAETISYLEKNGVAYVTLARKEAKNAINVVMVDELLEIFNKIEDEAKVKVVVILGHEDYFCQGIDLRDFPVNSEPDVYGFSRWEKTARTLERLTIPTIAAINGKAMGGGAQLTFACDIRIATNRASFCLNEVKKGFLPGMATFRLAKFIGLGRARNLILTGREISASEGKEIGLVDYLCHEKDFEKTILDICRRLTIAAPNVVGLARRLLDESFELAYEDFIGGFLAAQHRAARSEAFKKLVKKAHKTNTPQGEE